MKKYALFCLLALSLNGNTQPVTHDLSAYIMLDQQYLTDISSESGQSRPFYFRRIRAALDSKFTAYWRSQLEVGNNKNDNIEVKDAYLDYRINDYKIKIGWQKQAFGLENTMSSRNIATLERSMVAQSFALGRHPGFTISYSPTPYHFSLGYFNGNDDNDTLDGVISRFTTHYKHNQTLLHTGLNLAYRDWQTGNYRIKETPGLYQSQPIILGSNLTPSAVIQQGVELAWQQHNWLLQGEYMAQQVQVTNPELQQDNQYQGYYIQLSYMLGQIKYNYKTSRFTRPSLKQRPQTLEFVARHGHMDAFDNHSGSKADSQLLGVNYYRGKKLKLMLHYQQAKIARPTIGFVQKSSALNLRIQYLFR